MTPRLAASLAAAALFFALPARAAAPKELLGRWAMELDPSQVMVLKADGTGTFSGEPIRWQASGGRLAVTDQAGQTDTNAYKVQGDQLVIAEPGGLAVGFKRVGLIGGAARGAATAAGGGGAAGGTNGGGQARAPGGSAGGAGAPAAAPAGSPMDAQVRQLLLSSAWCSFSYSATPGGGGYGDRSSSSRVVFQADGSGFRGSSSESYSTGYGGTAAGGGRGGQPFRWQVQNGRLLIDTGAGFQDVNLDGKRNSNGYPILISGGVEYMSCR